MRIVKQLLFGLSCVTAGFILVALAHPAKKAQAELSIVLTPQRGYEVDGTAIPINKLEDVLRKNIRAKSERAKVTVLLHYDSRFADMSFLHGLLGAIGFIDVRFYAFDDDQEMMAEIVMDRPAIPFSLTPTNVSRSIITTPPDLFDNK